MPRYTRDHAHSRAASEKLSNDRVAGFIGIFSDNGPAASTSGVDIANQRRSPKVSANTVIAAAHAAPCAEG